MAPRAKFCPPLIGFNVESDAPEYKLTICEMPEFCDEFKLNARFSSLPLGATNLYQTLSYP